MISYTVAKEFLESHGCEITTAADRMRGAYEFWVWAKHRQLPIVYCIGKLLRPNRESVVDQDIEIRCFQNFGGPKTSNLQFSGWLLTTRHGDSQTSNLAELASTMMAG